MTWKTSLRLWGGGKVMADSLMEDASELPPVDEIAPSTDTPIQRTRLVGAGEAEALHGSAFFLQQGVTRWTDAHGFRRHDVRLGTAFRFALPHFAGAGRVPDATFAAPGANHRRNAPPKPSATSAARSATTVRSPFTGLPPQRRLPSLTRARPT